MNALDATKRSEAERKTIVDGFFARDAARVAAAPRARGMDYVHAYLVMEKEE